MLSDAGSFNIYLGFINNGSIATIKALLKIISKTQRIINSRKILGTTISITNKRDIENSDTMLTIRHNLKSYWAIEFRCLLNH